MVDKLGIILILLLIITTSLLCSGCTEEKIIPPPGDDSIGVSGVIKDAETQAGVENATVILDNNKKLQTGDEGHYWFNYTKSKLYNNKHTLHIEKEGYQTKEVSFTPEKGYSNSKDIHAQVPIYKIKTFYIEKSN